MKIILKKEKTIYGVSRKPGEEVEVRKEVGLKWVRDGIAKTTGEIPEEEKTEQAETIPEAVESPEEPETTETPENEEAETESAADEAQSEAAEEPAKG